MTVIVYPVDWPEGAVTVTVYPVDWPEGAVIVIVYPMTPIGKSASLGCPAASERADCLHIMEVWYTDRLDSCL